MVVKLTRRLYLGEWIDRLGHKRVEVADAVDMSEAYLSQIISGKRGNPSVGILVKIADFLHLTLEDLFTPPPSTEVAKAASHLSPTQLTALARKRPPIKKPGRK